jgi:hypothetical protein
VSFVPATAPFAMPPRVAVGATQWWEPFAAAFLTLAAIAVLVAFAARVYRGAILRTGATVKLRDAWSGAVAAAGALYAVTRDIVIAVAVGGPGCSGSATEKPELGTPPLTDNLLVVATETTGSPGPQPISTSIWLPRVRRRMVSTAR